MFATTIHSKYFPHFDTEVSALGILQNLTSRVFGTSDQSTDKQKQKNAFLRQCYFEVMEQRRVLSADPVVAGVTYLEGDEGGDSLPDHFEVTFDGGSETTEMTQFVISGDQDLSGTLSDGDMFFDSDAAAPGTAEFHGFQFDADGSSGVNASDIVSATVSDDGLSLTVQVDNFEAGDVLAFTIDVDEVEGRRNDRIASGVEFESSLFTATFDDAHFTFDGLDVATDTTLIDGFLQTQNEGLFYDEYDDLLAEGENISNGSLDLTRDNELGLEDRTAGAIDAYELVEKPIMISGTVFHDEDLDCVHDEDEDGIAGVEMRLQKLNETTGQYEDVAQTTTDAAGNYMFGKELGLKPGEYQIIEVQPDGFLDVGAHAGQVEGTDSGTVQSDGTNDNIITGISIPLGGTSATDYDFKEVKPASIQGNVWHDENDDGVFDPDEDGIANVLIQVTRVGAKDGVTNDPFADSAPIFVRTDANGHYSVDALPPGIYEVVEISNDPEGGNPLADFTDGKDTTGNVRGTTVGTSSNDAFRQIELCADDDGVEYNFGELKPASISGYVSVETPGQGKSDPTDPDFQGIEGVTLQLLDSDGNLLATTTTDETGNYTFDGLAPGNYTVVEVQPDGYIDAGDVVGSVDGQTNGLALTNDRFSNIELGSGDQGTRYDFCEHLPASIKGTVYHDRNDNGLQDDGEEGIGGVLIQLFDNDGNVVQETRTDANGDYCFEDLVAGTYKIVESQPTTFDDGKDTLGTVAGQDGSDHASGTTADDAFCDIVLEGGDQGTEYNFGELRLASISGNVWADGDGDKSTFDESAGDEVLANVEMILFDGAGNELARTFTDENGNYSFDGLTPGTYSVQQVQPDDYIDGGQSAGTVDGETNGQASQNLLSNITLSSGDEGVNYDFCEHIPASIKGTVYHDRNNDGVQNEGEEGIENVLIQLFDDDGNLVSEVLTDADGNYCFEDLVAGEYKLRETQPTAFLDGQDSLGTVDGLNRGEHGDNDVFCVDLKGGDDGVNYDFGEILPASIKGTVYHDRDNDGVQDSGEEGIENVLIQLFDTDGNLVSEVLTDADGNYCFEDLAPGEYKIRETQPTAFLDGQDSLGTVDGLNRGEHGDNDVFCVNLNAGDQGVNYDFGEYLPAEIHGRVWEDGPAFETEDGTLPENYRDQRDAVYQEGVDTPIEGVRMQLYFYIDNVSQELAPRPVTLSEVDASFYEHMNTNDPNAEVWVETMADGQYWFQGLQPGNYIVLETQPDGFADANDTAGSTTGFTFNSDNEAETATQTLTRTFSTDQLKDAVIAIQVNAGGVSVANNFSEVSVLQAPPTPDPANPIPQADPRPTPTGNPLTPRPGLTGFPGLFGSQPSAFTQFVGTARGGSFQTQATAAEAEPYSWHLSVVNGGLPRAVGQGNAAGASSVFQQAGYMNSNDWNRFDMTVGTWTFTETREADGQIAMIDRSAQFGMAGGIPLAGDFDGDGRDELAIYMDGYWMIDVNRNGSWDDTDLLAKLGDSEDRPVVGDWDGDGKDDIGIYGPMWERDPDAIEREPGLPNPDNSPFTKPKNVPPVDLEATNGARLLKLTSNGQQRADVVDHVFGVDDGEKVPVTGDWNGNGIRSIGTFEGGQWQMDVNGDGEFDHQDRSARFGKAGDVPLVGDFNGDGVEQIAVYRSGTWLIDSNGNRELDATDKTFQMGGAGDKPVVGDWDGDGIDEPGLYTDGQSVVRETL